MSFLWFFVFELGRFCRFSCCLTGVVFLDLVTDSFLAVILFPFFPDRSSLQWIHLPSGVVHSFSLILRCFVT